MIVVTFIFFPLLPFTCNNIYLQVAFWQVISHDYYQKQ